MSANKTVTSLRSSIEGRPTAVPQRGQNRAPAGSATEQREQFTSSTLPKDDLRLPRRSRQPLHSGSAD